MNKETSLLNVIESIQKEIIYVEKTNALAQTRIEILKKELGVKQ